MRRATCGGFPYTSRRAIPPRIDPETGYGLVTDVCLKRKIRNYAELVKGDNAGYRIHIKEGTPLNQNHQAAYIAVALEPGKKADLGSAKLANDDKKGTGFSDTDLGLLWDTLINMFEHEHSAAWGKMASRKLIVFQHERDLGNAPSHLLFDLQVAHKPGRPLHRERGLKFVALVLCCLVH